MTAFTTMTEIETVSGKPRWQVEYKLRRLGIEPDARAGAVRLWNRERLPEILASLGRVRKPKA